MWVKSYSKVFQGITKADVWRAWSDVNSWPTWDSELDYCKMDAAFVKGTQFILKPKGGPNVNITLSDVKPNESFTDYCKFFGATMYDAHTLEDTPDGLRITNTITMTGPLRFVWIHLVVKNIVASLPKQMDALVGSV